MKAWDVDVVWRELVRACVDRRHPWRVVSFCTQSADGPAARSVILRQVRADDRQLLFYTDARTHKLRDLAACPRVALLMWDAQHRRQLRLWGEARRVDDPDIIEAHWARIPEAARRDYATTLPPGTPLMGGDSPDVELNPAGARAHFVVLAVDVHRMEWLELRREGHWRVDLAWVAEDQAWRVQPVVP